MPKGDKNSLPYRWKDGCPESTRQKMTDSAIKRHQQQREQNENGRTIF